MINNYYKQSRQQSYQSSQKRAQELNRKSKPQSKSPTQTKSKAQQMYSNKKHTLQYTLPKGESKYYQECFPQEYTIFSLNNEIYFEKDIIKCKQKDSQPNTTFEESSDEDQIQPQDFTLLASFNPIPNTQPANSSRFVYSNRERIFQERRTSLSPLQRSLYLKNNNQLQSSKKKIFD
ncbi:unnamed protein product [Paramecium sonneborni]|uniref:Uncharacterized protein n=1 Tax=Paramecium sonneborni TaxID=65129 RepID=A0A8S1K7P5_9CILI|nr:unnamed protein product [Paramecium sonneborni]